MTTKSELFEQYDGKRHEISEGEFIVCNLKRTWSLDKIRQAIANWKAKIEAYKIYQEWEEKLYAHAAKLNYSRDEAKWTGVISDWAFLQNKGIEKDIERLEERIFKKPSQRQYDVIKTLAKGLDRHVRLYGDGRIAVSSSQGIAVGLCKSQWWEIRLDGAHRPIDCPIQDTRLYSQNTFVKLSNELGIGVKGTQGSFRVHIYYHMQDKDPLWYEVEISNPDLNEYSTTISTSSRSSLTPELTVKMGKALILAAAIAQDFQKFLDNPRMDLQAMPITKAI